ncbi:MAG: gliding motility lipoprotein GldH [Bacteroidota bacterium]|nr:gliding motility lipoprotein GldH [Bacteroidota bacterium]
MTKGSIRLLQLLSMMLLLQGCGRNVVFTDSQSMPGKTWKLSYIQVFTIPVKDTVHSNNIIFTIRTGSSYPFRNIWLFVTTISPDRKSITDTLQYELADEKGNWYGKGLGDIHELKLPYRKNVFFPVSGNYQVNVQHGMRVEDLKGVYDFGLRVEEAVKK